VPVNLTCFICSQSVSEKACCQGVLSPDGLWRKRSHNNSSQLTDKWGVGCCIMFMATNDVTARCALNSVAVGEGAKGDMCPGRHCAGGWYLEGRNVEFWNSAAFSELAFALQNRFGWNLHYIITPPTRCTVRDSPRQWHRCNHKNINGRSDWWGGNKTFAPDGKHPRAATG